MFFFFFFLITGRGDAQVPCKSLRGKIIDEMAPCSWLA